MFPKDIDIDALKEALEENEDEVECVWCNELFPKEDCVKEKDLGYLCPQCYQAIRSRGEPLTIIKEAMETTTGFKIFSNLDPDEEFWHFYDAGGGAEYYHKDFQKLADQIAELLAINDLEQCKPEELGTITRLILDKDYRDSYKLHREKFLVRAYDAEENVVDQEFFNTQSDAIAFRDNINNGNNKSFPNCVAKAFRKDDEKPISYFLKESLTESLASEEYLKYYDAVKDIAEEDFDAGHPFADDDFNQFSQIIMEQFPELAEEKSEVLWALWDYYFEALSEIQGDTAFEIYDNFQTEAQEQPIITDESLTEGSTGSPTRDTSFISRLKNVLWNNKKVSVTNESFLVRPNGYKIYLNFAVRSIPKTDWDTIVTIDLIDENDKEFSVSWEDTYSGKHISKHKYTQDTFINQLVNVFIPYYADYFKKKFNYLLSL